MTDRLQLLPNPPFWARLSVTTGNMIQLVGLVVSAALLYTAGHTDVADSLRIMLMILAWIVIYICGHSIGHYVVGRLVGIGFRGYGIRGTNRPESYPPGIRQLMTIIPFFTVMTEKSRMAKASPMARALMFAAGETSTTVCSIGVGWYAWHSHIPGGDILFIVSIVWCAVAMVITTVFAKGDYAKALRALASG